MQHFLAEDLDHVLAHTPGVWDDLRGGRVFITGGTGFFGTWLLESFAWANDRLSLGARAVVLTRDPARFMAKAPHLAHCPAIEFVTGNVTDFDFPVGSFSHVIHAATESASSLGRDDPGQMLNTIVRGTQRVLQFARHARARRFLLTSSGAVYGRQPAELSHIPEDFSGAPSPANISSAYAEGKRVAESLCTISSERDGIATTIARGFAFVGPHLPLDAHYAAGNFIRDALAGREIVVNGDGTPWRSYLYAADLAVWLWTILVRGQSARPYNVGSPNAVTIRGLADEVAKMAPGTTVRVMKQAIAGAAVERYVPSVARAETELGLRCWIDLPEAIGRTISWHRARRA